MRKILLTLLLTLTCTTILALTPPLVQEDSSLPPPKTEIQYPNNTTQPVNCFDYYKFGSVYASLETRNYTNISGTKMNFFGEIKNENSYPIVNGKLFVKIMRQNDTYEKTGGQDEVDSYVVKENIFLKANSSIPINFDWQIPAYALSGEYQASTYFIVDNSFNMSGLSFTTDIVGGVAKFAVQGEQKTTVFFDRTKIKLNNNTYYTVAFTPSVTETEPANITLTLTNTTKETQRVPVTLDLYVWDAQNQKNLLKQDTQTFLLNPNTSLEIPYTVTDTAHSVYFLQAKAQYQDTKSEVSVRFGRQNKQEPRINFTTLTTYPLEKDKENILLTCVHNTNNNDADYGKVITTIYNHTGTQIHQTQYEGKITGAIQGMSYKFTPQANYKDLTIETKIYDKAGAIINESKLEYLCSELSDNCAEPQFVFDTKTLSNSKSLLTLLGILLLLILLIFTKKHLKNKNIITSLLLLFVCGVIMVPQVAEAKTQQWSSYFGGTIADVSYIIDGIFGTINDVSVIERPGPGYTMKNMYFYINYHANVYDHDTKTLINENQKIQSGKKLDFVFGPFNYDDISWSGTGGYFSTPYGDWIKNAGRTIDNEFNNFFPFSESFMVSYGDYASILYYYDGIGSVNKFNRQYNLDINNVYGQFSVNPPSIQIDTDGGLTCGEVIQETNGDSFSFKTTCTVNNTTVEKNINPKFLFGQTYGKMHSFSRAEISGTPVNGNFYNVSGYYYQMLIKNISICREDKNFERLNQYSIYLKNYGITIPNSVKTMKPCTSYYYDPTFQYASPTEFIANVDTITIPFPLTIERCAATNTPPTPPSVTLTPATVTVGQNTSITFTSTDTQNDTITYQIDWGDGVITTETSPTLKSWTTVGTKTLKVRALDTCGESAWTTNTIVVNALPVLDPLTVTADPTCGSVVLNWNNNTATSYQVFRKEGTGSYSAVSPSLTTTTFTDTTITDGHSYTYQIWSGKSTISRLSNAMNATPTCPPPADLCNNIEDIQTTIPTGLASTAGNCTCGG